MSLPYALDASTPLSPSELAVLRGQYERELGAGHASTQTKFNYAWGLVKSRERSEVATSVGVLADIYRTDAPRRRECLYYLALGHFKLGNFDEARRFNALLLEREPNNLQAQSLAELIEKGVQREGYIGMALVGTAAAASAVVAAWLFSPRRR